MMDEGDDDNDDDDTADDTDHDIDDGGRGKPVYYQSSRGESLWT